MLTPAVQLLIVAWLPGAVIFRLPVARREKRAALDPEERLFWAVVISACVSLTVAIGLAVVRRYTFGRLLAADVAIAALLALASRFQLRLRPPRHVSASSILPLVLVCIGVWRFFPPSEYIIGGKDPGTYMNEGIQIAQRGALVVDDPVVAAVPAFARDLFFPSHQRADYHSVRFMGFFVKDPDSGAVVGQFPHAFPASIAIGYGLDGLTGARRAVGFWAIFGALAVYFTAARLVGRTAAWAAAALLCLHVIQVWFARYPNAEVVLQALLFAALLASARAHADDDPFFAPVAGLALGVLLFLRVEAFIGAAGVLAGLALAQLSGRRVKPAFAAVFVGAAVLAAAYLVGMMRAYTYVHVLYATDLIVRYAIWWIAGAVVLAAIVAASAFLLRGRWPVLNAWVDAYAPAALSAVLVGAAVYALWLRHPAGRLAAHDAYALRTFTAYYLTLPALLAALIGYVVWSRRAFWRAPELFTTVLVFSLFFFYKIRIVPDHFWMARRFLAVILPGALVFACGAALGTRSGPFVTRTFGRAVGAIFIMLLAAHYERASRPILNHVEYAGVIPRLEQIGATVDRQDLLIVESRNAGTDLHTLALPLAYIYDRSVLVLNSPLPDKAMFAAFLDWARTRYGRVLFMGGGGTDLNSSRWGARVIAADRFQVPEYHDPSNDYPRFARPKQFDYTIFELTPAGAPVSTAIDLDIGDKDDLNVLRFYAKEQTDNRLFRWSRDFSYVVLPRLSAAHRSVTIWMSDGGRPAAAGPADVRVSLGGETLGTVRATSGFTPHTLPIPAPLAARLAAGGEPVQLRLDTAAWVPERVLGTADDRALGVMVDRVAVQ